MGRHVALARFNPSARPSGLSGIPEPLASYSTLLVRPIDDNIDSTVANGSDGARFIIETSKQLSLPFRPPVVVSAGRLTDLADAYVTDPVAPERVAVVAAMGTTTTDGAQMDIPNGENWPEMRSHLGLNRSRTLYLTTPSRPIR